MSYQANAERIAATNLVNEDQAARVFATLAVAEAIDGLASAVSDLADAQKSSDLAESIEKAGDYIARGLTDVAAEIQKH